ncbi:hypothetical protein P8452_11365 [Trifolium repens]|nr:hypothetical protein P8452_11365 [Trifolium repens]
MACLLSTTICSNHFHICDDLLIITTVIPLIKDVLTVNHLALTVSLFYAPQCDWTHIRGHSSSYILLSGQLADKCRSCYC